MTKPNGMKEWVTGAVAKDLVDQIKETCLVALLTDTAIFEVVDELISEMVDGQSPSDRAQIWLDSKSTDKVCFSFWDGEPFLVDFFIPKPDMPHKKEYDEQVKGALIEIETLKRFRADVTAIIDDAESELAGIMAA